MMCPEQRMIPLTFYNSFKKLSVILTWEGEWQVRFSQVCLGGSKAEEERISWAFQL